jgi:hypothetical protein
VLATNQLVSKQVFQGRPQGCPFFITLITMKATITYNVPTNQGYIKQVSFKTPYSVNMNVRKRTLKDAKQKYAQWQKVKVVRVVVR